MKLLDHIFQKMLLQPDFVEAVRSPHYSKLANKVQKMKAKIKQAERARQIEDRLAQVTERT